MAKRYKSLDGLRGILALLVMLFHSLQNYPDIKVWIPASACVTVFFVLSGFVLTISPIKNLKAYDWISYYISRLIRLLLPCFAILTICVMADFVLHFFGVALKDSMFNSGDFLSTLRYVLSQYDIFFYHVNEPFEAAPKYDGALWSMTWELLFSLMLPIFLIIASLFKSTKVKITGIVIVVAISGIGALIGYRPLRYLPIFLVGCILATILVKNAETSKTSKRLKFISIIVLIVLAAVCFEARTFIDQYYNSFFPFTELFTMLWVVGGVILIILALKYSIISKILKLAPINFLGRISFSLYITHICSLQFVWLILDRLSLPKFVSAPITIIFILVVAYAFHKFIEQPSMRLGKKLASKYRDSSIEAK
jgi:peptidoglycan/LPS O-acetylase OafA/YrhL